jgi:hypothetical protein
MRAQAYYGTGTTRQVLLIIFLMTFMAGCTAYYTKPGRSTAEFNRDKQYCEGIGKQEAARKGTRVCDEIDRCLVNTKGWKRD